MKSNIDGIAVIDEKRKFKYIDRSFAQLYGYSSPPKLIGKPWTETYEKLHLQRFEEEMIPLLDKENWWSGVIFGVKSKGEQFSQKVFVFKLEKGELVFLVKNIAPRERSIFEIGQPEYNWPEAVVSPPDIVAIISTEYEIMEINSPGAKKLNKAPRELEGAKCFEEVHQQSNPVEGCPCKKTIETGEAGIGEISEGGRDYVVTSFPLRNGSSKIAAFLHTVTEVHSDPPGELMACDFFIRGLSQLKSEEGIYSFLLNFMNEVLDCVKLAVFVRSGDKLKCKIQRGYRRPIKGEELYLAGSGARVESFKRNETLYLPNVKGKENFIRQDPKVSCEFVTPIATSKDKFGVIDIRRYRPNSITPTEKNLVEVIASEVAKRIGK